MKKNLLAYTIVSMFLVLSPSFTCVGEDEENCHYHIGFTNESEKELYVNYSAYYPDTTNAVLDDLDYYSNRVFPGKINKEALLTFVSWEFLFGADIDHKNLNSIDTLMVFIFDAKRLEANPSHIDDAFLQRYDLSLQDLQRLNWMLSYPPTESMKDIKMWPRY